MDREISVWADIIYFALAPLDESRRAVVEHSIAKYNESNEQIQIIVQGGKNV